MKLALVVAMALQQIMWVYHPNKALPRTPKDTVEFSLKQSATEPVITFVKCTTDYCDEFSYCGAIYDGKWFQVPYVTVPIPKELQ